MVSLDSARYPKSILKEKLYVSIMINDKNVILMNMNNVATILVKTKRKRK